MRGGHLANPQIATLLKPFVIIAWNGAGTADMPADIRRIYYQSPVPKTTNVYMFVLDHQGQLVHGFHALHSGRQHAARFAEEIRTARTLLKLPEEPAQPLDHRQRLRLPDLEATDSGLPAGVRLFIRPAEAAASQRLVVELVATPPEDWHALAYADGPRRIDAARLRAWWVQMYPPAIRTADQSKPFTSITGTLMWEPAGADAHGRYALLHGQVTLTKGDETQSAFEGTVRIVLSYGTDAPHVQSLQGIIQGDYLYRVRGTQRIPLTAAIESRPGPQAADTR